MCSSVARGCNTMVTIKSRTNARFSKKTAAGTEFLQVMDMEQKILTLAVWNNLLTQNISENPKTVE